MNLYYKDLTVSYKISFGTLNLALRGWAVRTNFETLKYPTDRLSFRGSPVLTNAWYQVSKNSIAIPIGELHSPAFGSDYPSNILYGGLGSLIGHEMSHGFYDPEGAQFDGEGNKVDWWSNYSKANFNKFKTCLSEQYDTYCYSKEIGCVNGKNTFSENSADLAGLKIAYKVYKMWGRNERLAKAPMITSAQLFFLSFPLYFCGEQTDTSLKNQLQTDSHTPAKFRVNGALRNMHEFANAFQCEDLQWMNPDVRCTL